MSPVSREQVATKLIEWGREQVTQKTPSFTEDEAANTFITENPLAFLIAAILNERMKAEIVWANPYELYRRLGHLDIRRIADMGEEELEEIFRQKPAIHRYWRKMAKRIRNACKLVIERYDGQVETLWNDNPRCDDLQRRFEQFDGIDQKKASMTTNILVRDLDIQVRDRRGIDVSYDVHVRRVFVRTGFSDKDDGDSIIQSARELSSDYPGALDLPCWLIGRQWCHPRNPDCQSCLIEEVCHKVGLT